MTARQLEQLYREAEMKRVTMDVRTLADYVAEVIIPAAEKAARLKALEDAQRIVDEHDGYTMRIQTLIDEL